MNEQCWAKIRPMPNDTEILCGLPGKHMGEHRGTLRDYAYPGSATVVTWLEDDRRNFQGDWIPCTRIDGCILPSGHRGDHAQ